MKHWLWLALAFFVCVLAPVQAQETAAGVECPTCKGKTRALQSCRACAGDGKVACRMCGPRSRDFQLPETEALTKEERQEIEDNMRRVVEEMDKLDAMLGRARTVGRVPCPAMCAGGRLFLRRELECAYCAGKGWLACPDCDKKGSQRCMACAGRGKLERVCGDCAGSGRLPDPGLRPLDRRATCAWCEGFGARACRECDAARQEIRSCPTCRGAKRLTCEKCVGTKLKPCRWCDGAGRRAGTPGLSPDVDCSVCKMTGRADCTECIAEGSLECKTCGGRGTVTRPCSALGAEHVRPCVGCALGASRSWQVNAEILAARGARSDAAGYLEVELERTDASFAGRIRDHVGPEPERAALEKARAAARKELEKRIAALRAKPG